MVRLCMEVDNFVILIMVIDLSGNNMNHFNVVNVSNVANNDLKWNAKV